MGYIIMGYGEECLKEYYLPDIDNSNYSFLLKKELFGLREHVRIDLEVLDHKWYFRPSTEYQLKLESEEGTLEEGLMDGMRILLRLPNQYKITLLVFETKETFQIYRKYRLDGLNQIFVGSGEENTICYLVGHYISRNHMYLSRLSGGWQVTDTSSNGTYIDSCRIHGSRFLSFGECITVFGLRIFFLGNVIAVGRLAGELKIQESLLPYEEEAGERSRPERKKQAYFKRSPRIVEKLYDEEIEIESPPQYNVSKKKPLLLTIGPCFTMAIPMLLGCGVSILSALNRGSSSGAFMFTGLITAVSSAVIGTIWALTNLNYAKKEEQEAEELRFNAYRDYLEEKTEFIRHRYEENRAMMYRTNLSGDQCCGYQKYDINMWNRNPEHEDFLRVRLGIGTVPFQAPIKTQPEKFTLVRDDLSEKPRIIKEDFKTLYDVPYTIDLEKHPLIGVIGGYQKQGAYELIKNLVAQIAVHNCYTEVKLGFIYQETAEENRGRWEFAKWLPHVWMSDKKTRLIAENKNEVGDIGYELSRILRMREEGESVKNGRLPNPYYILVVSDQELLEGELLEKYIMTPREEYGLTTLLLVERYDELPNSCQTVIQNAGSTAGIFDVRDGIVNPVAFEYLDTGKLENMSRMLSDILVKEAESGGEVPANLDFFEMYGIDELEELHVEERWRKNRTYESMKAVIGRKSGGSDCYLDIHEKYHGPHGLVAGTTGSGKSETLQTYILSLAVNFSPDDVGFFIIDFKGGGMANLFDGLPHMIGQISNLSGNQVRRAMISIKSENMRRQRIFHEHSVNNINLYTRLYKNNEATIPVPHLFIIIDEFAELKREEPEFMKELISVAQVGRSLGVHLILATQKPSGTVDDNIWSNSKFRLCLRVQDKQDSTDMLHKPDAAYITQAGRGYLQVGNDEIYELFQSGYSGAAYEKGTKGGQSSIATMLTITGKAALVGNTARKKKKDALKKTWLAFLMNTFLGVMADMGFSARTLYDLDEFPEMLLDRLYEAIGRSEFDYDRAPFQIARIRDYLSVWPDGAGTKLPIEEAVDMAVRQAQIRGVKLPEQKEKTQLDAVIEYLASESKRLGYQESMQLWLPVLPETLYLNTLGESLDAGDEKWHLSAVVGLYDDPENQAQRPLEVSFSENGHYALCGMVSTGKSAFLQTLVYALIRKYTPGELNIYALDYSSHMLAPFENAPQVGGVVYDTEDERVKRLFFMLDRMMNQRKELLKGGNYAQYVQVNGITLPAVLVVIDNFAGFKEKTENRYENILIRISREGVGYGIFLIISAAGFSASEIQNRIGDNLRTVITMDMGDKFKYVDTLRTTHIDILPEAGVAGRGLAVVKGRILEYQTALSVEARNDYDRIRKLEEYSAGLAKRWDGLAAMPIPEIPEKPVLQEFASLAEYGQIVEEKRYLPMGYDVDDASVVSMDLRSNFCYLITGKGRTGKTNVLKVLLKAAGRKDADLCIIELERTELKSAAEQLHARYLATPEEMYRYFLTTVDVFKERNQKKRAYLEQGMEEEELAKAVEEERPVFIFISDLEKFVEAAYKPLEKVGPMNPYLENITEKGSLHGFYFIACMNTDNVSSMLGRKIYTNMTSYRTGIHLGGNTAQQKLFNFTNIPFSEQNKAMKIGLGLYPSPEDSSTAKRIVIPQAKGAEL